MIHWSSMFWWVCSISLFAMLVMMTGGGQASKHETKIFVRWFFVFLISGALAIAL